MTYSETIARQEISDYNAEMAELYSDELQEWHAFLDEEYAEDGVNW